MGLLLGVAVTVASGRIMIRYTQCHHITIDDGFFYFAILALIISTVLLYLSLTYTFLLEDIQAGLQAVPAGMSH